MATCKPGVHEDEPRRFQDPWSCKQLSQPAPTTAAPTTQATVPARTGAAAAEPSLFCFSTLAAGELDLAKSQLAEGAGIFGCDAWAVFSEMRSVELAAEPKRVLTTVLPHGMVVGEGFQRHTYLAAWEQVYLDGLFQNHTVVVKASFRTAFLPGRLREQVRNGQVPVESKAAYVRTSQAAFGGNGGMAQALELMSSAAIQVYGHGRLRNAARCLVELPYQDLAEDIFMQECMDLLGVDHVEAFGLLREHDESCAATDPVAFYPFDRPETLAQCVSDAEKAR
jgi:hypothetical protein